MNRLPDVPGRSSGSNAAAPWPRALVFSLAVALCYANSLDVPFLLDDPHPGVPLDYATRPLVWASFDLNRALGAALAGYHVFNALVHLACGFLLFGVLRRSAAHAAPGLAERARTEFAFVTSLLWLVHPLQTASITYLSQRAEAMASLSYLGVLYAFLRAATAARPRPWQALALLALGLGFATKEIVATAPLVVWLFDALFLSGGPLAALRRRPGFYAALALLALGLVSLLVAPILLRGTTTAGLRFEEFGPLEYARTEAGVVLHYLRLAFWPHPLRFDYGWPIAHAPGDWLPESAAIAALLAATVVLCLRRSWVGFALASFFLVLAPTSSFVPILDPAFEHRMYLPLAAVLVLAAAGAGRLLGSGAARRLRAPLACAVALALAARTIRRNQDYRSEVELWRLTVAHAPEHARAHANLGSALLDAGRTQEAIAELLAALSLDTRDGYASLAVSPVAYLKLGHAYTRLQQPERALPFYRRAAELAEWPDSLEALATALAGQGDDAGAAVQLGKLLALRPHDAGAHARLAETLVRLGRAEEARTHFELAARLAPEREEAHVGLASLLVAQGEPSEALEHARRALAIEPDTAGEHFALGQALGALGRSEEAMAAFREAMRLAPELPAPCAAFARSVCMLPDASPELREEALRLASRAIELSGSTHAGFLEVGAMTHAALGDFARAARLLEQALELPDGGGLAGRLRAQREDYLRRAGG